MRMATGDRHTPEQVVHKLAQADRAVGSNSTCSAQPTPRICWPPRLTLRRKERGVDSFTPVHPARRTDLLGTHTIRRHDSLAGSPPVENLC